MRGGRNTRSVVAVRLSDDERVQIAGAAGRLGVTVSGFIRQSALQASALVQGKATVRTPTPAAREPEAVVVFDAQPSRVHYVDGEAVRRMG